MNNIFFFNYVCLAREIIEFLGLSGMHNKLPCLPRRIMWSAKTTCQAGYSFRLLRSYNMQASEPSSNREL